MKDFFKIIISLLLLLTVTTCKKEPVGGLILDPSELVVCVGKTANFTVTFLPKNATNKNVSWESSDPAVATVSKGIVTGIALGKVKITVTSQDGGRTASAWVYVKQPIEPEEMIWVEGGTFMMGCTEEQGDDCSSGEKPAHKVTLDGFYISKYTVTQKEWVATMRSNPSYTDFTGDNIPVHCITWDVIQEYIERLNEYTGKQYRLPTEAEWEYAARGGSKSRGYKYSGSNDPDEVAWYILNPEANPESIYYQCPPVGQKKPNELGIYDMSGHVWEFCSDWYGAYSGEPQTNPTGPETGTHRVFRGGSYYSDYIWSRISYRAGWPPQNRTCNGGFRLVLDKK